MKVFCAGDHDLRLRRSLWGRADARSERKDSRSVKKKLDVSFGRVRTIPNTEYIFYSLDSFPLDLHP